MQLKEKDDSETPHLTQACCEVTVAHTVRRGKQLRPDTPGSGVRRPRGGDGPQDTHTHKKEAEDLHLKLKMCHTLTSKTQNYKHSTRTQDKIFVTLGLADFIHKICKL